VKTPKKSKVVCNREYCDALAQEFRERGYQIECEEDDWYNEHGYHNSKIKQIVYNVIGYGIRGAYACTNREGIYSGCCYIGSRFSVDNNKAFDSISRCPMRVQLPLNKIDKAKIWEHLDFLGSKLGQSYSEKMIDDKLPLCTL
jgi:hypothetical protein